jgi:four helix bundle protein
MPTKTSNLGLEMVAENISWDLGTAAESEEDGEALVVREGLAGDGIPPTDLLERTAQFGESIIRFAKRVPLKAVNQPLITQLVSAGTSVGANYCEADDAVSGKDYRHKIGICRKESKESMFFLRMIAASEETLKDEARALWREAKELNLIFGRIWRNRA